jgi:hypothetical protein
VLGKFKHWVGVLVKFVEKKISIFDSLQIKQGRLQHYDYDHKVKFELMMKVTCDV